MSEAVLSKIISSAQLYLPGTDLKDAIEKAFQFASRAHEGQKRLSGEPYITHSLAVAERLMTLKPDLATIQAALLHDVPEDTSVSLAEIENHFGPEVAQLLSGMPKIGKIRYRGDEQNIEDLKKLFLAISKDMRVALIKLCDRLHNLETLHYHQCPEKRRRIASETLYIYAPIAARLGIYSIKTRLEELCFKELYPESYTLIIAQLDRKSTERETFLQLSKLQLSSMLQDHSIKAEVIGRVKSAYSIFKKLQQKQRSSLDELYDIFALRVIVNDQASCYAALGIIHSRCIPLSHRFKDYIAVPKSNNYRSLHTTVMGLGGELRDQPTEIQIRSRDMHQQAEFGIAAHHVYKEKGGSVLNHDYLNLLGRMEQDFSDDFSSLEKPRGRENIYVLTPRGEIKELPVHSTPVDFAYLIHTDIGHRCRGARVDGVIVPLDYELQSGEVVEIMTRSDPRPSEYWLSFVKTGGARTKIRSWFLSQSREYFVARGKDLLNEYLLSSEKPMLDPELSILKKYDDRVLSLSDREHVIEMIGNGSVGASSVARKLFPPERSGSKKAKPVPDDKKERTDVLILGETGMDYRMAACCNAISGQEITGYVTRGKSISIHRRACKTLRKLDRQRLLAAAWQSVTRRGADEMAVNA